MDTVATGLTSAWTDLTALWAAATPAAVDGEEITVQPSEPGQSYAIEVLQATGAPGLGDKGHLLGDIETLGLVFAAAGRRHYARAYMESTTLVATGEGISGDRGAQHRHRRAHAAASVAARRVVAHRGGHG